MKRVMMMVTLVGVLFTGFTDDSYGAQAEGHKGQNSRLWDNEPSLWDVAQEVTFARPVQPDGPEPFGTLASGTAVNLSTQELKISLWGPPSALTLSLGKTDVWDRRRLAWESPLTLAQIGEKVKQGQLPNSRYYGSFSAAFPCPKPVGQVIISAGDLEGASLPVLITECSSGTSKVEINKWNFIRQSPNLRVTLKYLPMMTDNLIAIECDFEGLTKPVFARLYRHCDTKNSGIEAPKSGQEGLYFWITQKLPVEKTFPAGFEYFMVGRIVGCQASIETVDGKAGLGTPPRLPPRERKGWPLPQYEAISNAEGSAATATLVAKPQVKFTLLVSVVTTAEAANPLAEAKRLVDIAAEKGFDKLVVENADWYKGLYQRREKGRIFKGSIDYARSQVRDIFESWCCPHSSRCLPDASRYEADAQYAYLEQDSTPWHGLCCYNELYYTSQHVWNRSDRLSYWYSLVPFWLSACKKNAHEVFDMPGAALLHGYLPPTKADEYAHCHSVWEFCMEIPAQVLKVLWDAYDYGGDEKFLADVVYPSLRETAIFYSHYATLGDDGRYHVIPTVSAEKWGWTKDFERNRDSTSALCMFKWLLGSAADASELLGRDAELRGKWREVASKMAPYPTYKTPEGTVFTDVRDVNPIGVNYNWFAGNYPTRLADEINLDSPPEQKELMLRTARLVKGWKMEDVGPLLGTVKGTDPEQLINSRSGRIHLFPAVPPQTTIAFRDMQARGGFEVSAECIQGKVTYIHLRARRNVTCRIMNPWPGKKVQIRELFTEKVISHELDMSQGECTIFLAQRGREYVLRPQ